MMSYYGYGHLWNPFGFLSMIFCWGIVIFIILVLVRKTRNSGGCGIHDHNNKTSALQILKERYAKGEMDRKEFEEKKRDIS